MTSMEKHIKYVTDILQVLIVELHTKELNVEILTPVTLNAEFIPANTTFNTLSSSIEVWDLAFNKKRTIDLTNYCYRYLGDCHRDYILSITNGSLSAKPLVEEYNKNVVQKCALKEHAENENAVRVTDKINKKEIKKKDIKYILAFDHGQLIDKPTIQDLITYERIDAYRIPDSRSQRVADALGISIHDLHTEDADLVNKCKDVWKQFLSLKIDEIKSLIKDYGMTVDTDMENTFASAFSDPAFVNAKTPAEIANYWPSALYPKPQFVA